MTELNLWFVLFMGVLFGAYVGYTVGFVHRSKQLNKKNVKKQIVGFDFKSFGWANVLKLFLAIYGGIYFGLSMTFLTLGLLLHLGGA